MTFMWRGGARYGADRARRVAPRAVAYPVLLGCPGEGGEQWSEMEHAGG